MFCNFLSFMFFKSAVTFTFKSEFQKQEQIFLNFIQLYGYYN